MSPLDTNSLRSCSRSCSVRLTRKSSWGTPILPPSSQEPQSLTAGESFEGVELSSYLDGLHVEGVEAWSMLDNLAALGLTINHQQLRDSGDSPVPFPRVSVDGYGGIDASNMSTATTSKGPFHRWMKTLHRRSEHRGKGLGDGPFPWQLLDPSDRAALARRMRHRKSSSGSSFGFVAAVKSASISLASESAIVRSRRNTARSRGYSSSRTSMNGGRLSEDCTFSERRTSLDLAITDRALQRRRILEELISTEESYIGDVRFLMNVRVSRRLHSLDAAHMRQTGLCHDSSVPTNSSDRVTILNQWKSDRDSGAPRRNSWRLA
jgi:hypothetical protein